MVEQLICNQQVGGSSPSTGSNQATALNRLEQLNATRMSVAGEGLTEPLLNLSSPSTGSNQTEEHNMGEFPSGQRGQTVNLLRIASMVRIRPPPPQKS